MSRGRYLDELPTGAEVPVYLTVGENDAGEKIYINHRILLRYNCRYFLLP